VGQQFDQNGVALKDRKGNPLSFTPDIAPTMIETGANLEVTGIRVAKYYPDFSDAGGKYYSSNSGNSFMFFRYPELVLMVAEAYYRLGGGTPANMQKGLDLINLLRTARGASTLAALPLNPSAGAGRSLVDDPNCLLAERGRELYLESVRRTDLIRFGVFLTAWQYKAADSGPTNLLFPVPNQALGVNPNLVQNPGY
jgi:hypothetical protein